MERNYCPAHEDNKDDLKEIKASVIKTGQQVSIHSGQWKVLLWGMSLLGGSLLILIVNQGRNTHANNLTISSYIAQHSQEAQDGFRRIEELEEGQTTILDRMNVVEKRLDRIID